MIDISEILIFNLYGKFANFKKFYSNTSSLTYKIPTRTVLMGIVASIMEEERNSYYEWLSPNNAKFGIKILKPSKTHFECMNYLNLKDGGRTQTRLELLMAKDGILEYEIYFWCRDIKKFKILEDRIKNQNLGYGIYLGQRQFRGDVKFKEKIMKKHIEKLKNYKGKISTLTYSNNVTQLLNLKDIKLISDRMPIYFSEVIENDKKTKLVTRMRIPEKKEDVVFEENGRNIEGEFKEVIRVGNEYISFFTPCMEVL